MKKNKIFYMSIGIFLILLTITVGVFKGQNGISFKIKSQNYYSNNSDFSYLSDIIPIESSVGYKTVGYDKSVDGGNIYLQVNGVKKLFYKGISAHATSTLIYDLKDYSYDTFMASLGIDANASSAGADGVKFEISVSNDKNTWTNLYTSPKAQKVSMDAVPVSLTITGYRYLKLQANQLGNKTADHATYGNAKLAKSTYVEDNTPVTFFKTVAEYDQIIQSYSLDTDISTYELVLLQRTFVKNVGYDLLQAICQYSESNKNTVKWLLENKEVLKEYLTGGKLDGTYADSIKILSNLYTKHSSDLLDMTIDPVSGVVNGKVYEKMMIALSLSHTRKIGFWMDESQRSDAVVRYETFKNLRSNGLLENNIFDGLPIIDMRLVFNSLISDEQITWLNYYVRLNGNNKDPYHYIRYTGDYNYFEDQYYLEENYDKWNTKYHLNDFNIPYGITDGKKHPKLWMMFEEGAVCGGLSKTGTNINTSRGVPALVLGQPGHAAYMVYSKTADGKGKWELGNDVSGWAQSYWTYEGNVATGWGTESWAGFNNATYTLLSQAALNDLENYQKAEEYLFLADVYKTNNATDYDTLEKIYNMALEKQSINFSVWKEFLNLYKADLTKTETDILTLSSRMASALTYYPSPMFFLLKQFETSMKTDSGLASLNILQQETLKKATKATANDVIQPAYAIHLANYLLGKVDLSIASFSFSGENANKIVLAPRFSESLTRLKYSLDGGATWMETDQKEILLTQEQIDSIDVNKDILVALVGASDYQTIDIIGATEPKNIYNNDLENRVIGTTAVMEWSFDQANWTLFSTQLPDLTGNKTVYVRIGANGTTKAGAIATLNFTAEKEDFTQVYIPLKHLSISEASSFQGGQEPSKAIDGNLYTMWHVRWDGSDKKKYITIKLDEPMYISGLEYFPGQANNNGMIQNGKVMVSMDGINFEEAATITNWPTNKLAKKITFPAVEASYVRLVATQSIANYANAAIINLFKDDTKLPPSVLDKEEGIYDTYRKGEHHKDLTMTITKNSELLRSLNIDGEFYSLTDFDKNKLIIEETETEYKVTLLSSWLNTLEKGEHYIAFFTNKENALLYNYTVADTYQETDQFISNDKLGSVKLSDKVDSTFQLKIDNQKIEENLILSFKEHLQNKTVIGIYDIAIFDENQKVNYDNSIAITLQVGTNYRNQQVTIFHEKNGNIETYTSKVNENGNVEFTSTTGLSQFVLAIENKQNEESPENNNPTPPNENKPENDNPTPPKEETPENKPESNKPNQSNSNKKHESILKQTDKMVYILGSISVLLLGTILFLIIKWRKHS